jgi:hypothetical protein
MQKTILFIPIILWTLIISSVNCNAQESPSKKKHTHVKTISDIPHKTTWQKWMWIHRSMAFKITKEHPVNYDTAYIKSYYKRLVITIPISTRFLDFSLIDQKNRKKLTFAPNLQYALGISISSRWASFIINSGVNLFINDDDIKGKTWCRDYQLNLYGRIITTDMFMQNYHGYYIKNTKSFSNYVSDRPYAVRSDVNALNMEVSSYYILNNKRFSYGNSFGFVEQQKKSAGSILTGLYYSYFEASGSPSLVTFPFRSSFDTVSFIRGVHMHNFGINLGYIYTLVFLKECYATASFVQGIGARQVRYTRDDNLNNSQLAGGADRLNVRLALGYNNGRYFIGTMEILNYYFLRGKLNPTFDYSFGKFMIYIGYRFSVLKKERKLLHEMKLIDY